MGLLNVLEERDIQVRGYKIRLPLDVVMFASANPEDYTNRGRIIVTGGLGSTPVLSVFRERIASIRATRPDAVFRSNSPSPTGASGVRPRRRSRLDVGQGRG